MQIYASQNNGAIPGSAHTSSRFIYLEPNSATPTVNPAYNDNNCPSVCDIFDWASPIAHVMGIKFEEGATKDQRVTRFNQLRELPAFRCPENEFQAIKYSGSAVDAKTGPMISYNTAMGFLLTRNNSGSDSAAGVGRTVARTDQNPPSGYNVKLAKVGDASRKIYIADGARYTTTADAPDYDLSYLSSFGGAFADQGACMQFSRSWDRGLAAGNANLTGGTRNAHVYAYRHGPMNQRHQGRDFPLQRRVLRWARRNARRFGRR